MSTGVYDSKGAAFPWVPALDVTGVFWWPEFATRQTGCRAPLVHNDLSCLDVSRANVPLSLLSRLATGPHPRHLSLS
jgi:hypothetical protein